MIFERNDITVFQKVSKAFFNDNIQGGVVTDDFVNEMVTLRAQSFYYERKAETREVKYLAPKPSFLDWVLGRRREVVYRIEVKELLLNPTPGTERIIDISLKDK